MRSHRLQRWVMVAVVLGVPLMAYAQEATLSGTVTDTTGGALPGVTVRAVHEASGNSFEAVTDERGDYRLAVRVGAYRVTAELSGFAPVTRTLALLVGQQAVVNLQMGVSGVQESVTVTGEAPLLDTTQSSLGGNVDPRQLQDLPINGRNWLDLVLLAPGSRANALAFGEAPHTMGGTVIRGDFQINLDGQQVTSSFTSFVGDGQPRFSRDAIAEFEFLSGRFDATQSRSSGVQINAITKSGTNTPSGSFSGYFRDDRFIAKDFIAKRVLPYQNQQLSGTFGGPIRRDKLHVFANYEYERLPQSLFFVTPYPTFNAALDTVDTEKKPGVRVDAQFSPRTRLTVRGTWARLQRPGALSASPGETVTLARLRSYNRDVNQYLGTLSQVLSNRAVNEIKVGYAYYRTASNSIVKNSRARFVGLGSPIIKLQGLEMGQVENVPERQSQAAYSIRDDFTYSFTRGGRHTVKLGAEYLYSEVTDFRCVPCEGLYDATLGPIPANIESLFPDVLNADTWNLAALSPITVSVQGVFGKMDTVIPRYTTGVWVQDDWTVLPRLTLNLGLRYDVELNAFANDVEVLPWMPGNRPNDTNNVSPRLGFSLSANDRTVIRGGFGLYFGSIYNAHLLKYPTQAFKTTAFNDGRPDFASNPFPGLTFESILAKLCTPALEPGCLRRDGVIYPANFQMPFSYQSSIGLQRQLGTTMAFEADYVYIGTRKAPITTPPDNVNLTYNPATGVNYPFSDISRRPFPHWGVVTLTRPGVRFNSHALQTAFTKRMSDGWQLSGTYTLAGLWDALPRPVQWTGSALEAVPFATAPDLGGEYSLAVSDQRHRAVINGIWQLRYGFQLSGLYFYGSGERYPTSWGVNFRGAGGNSGEKRLRPNGTYVPRNNFVGKPIHRVDLRLQRRFPLGGRVGIDGILELFNVFNHANYGRYVTQEVSRLYGQPQQNALVAYLPRMLQLGFRVAF